jgi:hypothetical protein
LACIAAGGESDRARIVPLRRAHAHNDYQHKRPLLDALDCGFCSVEADIFLWREQLLVGHTFLELRNDRTLEKLYLDPLTERVKKNKGRVYPDGPAFFLLIDVKTEADRTHAALKKVLAAYCDILSVTQDGKFEPKAVTVIISGNFAREAIASEKTRYAGIDGRLADLDSAAAADLVPCVSADWKSVFRWRGEGPMPEAERSRLKELVKKAHARNRLLRFWRAPDELKVWSEQFEAGVDLINTDNLAALQAFLFQTHKKLSD